MKIEVRDVPPRAAWALEQTGVHPLLARLYAARGVTSAAELDDGLARLLSPADLKGAQAAAVLLADAIAAGKRLCIVADYDCDGATACAVGLRGLRLLGAQHVDYLVPDRVVDGYGLTPPIAERVAARGADLLITVDNGIASVEGVARARELGLQVLVTDHHLPAAASPPGRPKVASVPSGGSAACEAGSVGAVVLPQADVIYVNAGAIEPYACWRAALRPGGRLLFPLEAPGAVGAMLLVQRGENAMRWPARFLFPVAFIACEAARDSAAERRLARRFADESWRGVRSLRFDAPDETCWLAGDGWRLSTAAP